MQDCNGGTNSFGLRPAAGNGAMQLAKRAKSLATARDVRARPSEEGSQVGTIRADQMVKGVVEPWTASGRFVVGCTESCTDIPV
jgi:hypothetical protein